MDIRMHITSCVCVTKGTHAANLCNLHNVGNTHACVVLCIILLQPVRSLGSSRFNVPVYISAACYRNMASLPIDHIQLLIS